jgi:hypothetical protein
MISKKPTQPIPFRTSPAWDIFDVFVEMPRSKQATDEMKALCDKFVADYTRMANRYTKEGLSDSASREMVIRYVLEKIEPWRKMRREREERGLKALPPHTSRKTFRR